MSRFDHRSTSLCDQLPNLDTVGLRRHTSLAERYYGDFLEDEHIELMPPQLVMVVGEVGAGKSSLLAAILGEMYRDAVRNHSVEGWSRFASAFGGS